MPEPAAPADYVEWEPPVALRRHVACTWASSRSPGADRAAAEPVLPDGCIDIVWDGRRLVIAGPDTRPSPADPTAAVFVGVRFRPGAGPRFLGLPAGELRDRQVELGLVWPVAEQLGEALSCAADLRSAAALLEEHLEGRLGAVAPPDALVEAAATSWSGGLTVSPGALAARAGITERQAHRRFVQAVGYGPKFLQRVLRFQAFLAAASSTPAARLGELGAAAGFADQAHLTREARSLAGRTPRELRANRVRNVQDTRPRPT